MTESEVIKNNAAEQNKLNKENAAIKFAILPPGADTNKINEVTEENEEFAAMREDIQNDLITCRQTAQVEMTQTTTNVDILEQDASENTGWLKTLNTIFKVIDEMNKR